MEYEGIELGQYLAVIRRWLWLIVLGTFLAGATALVVSFLMTPIYQAEARVLIVRAGSEIVLEPRYRTLTEEDLAPNMQERRKALTALVANSTIASQVIEELGSILEPEEREAGTLVGMVKTELDGDLIRILVEADSPEKATAIANAWAHAYEGYVNSLYFGTTQSPADLQIQADEALGNYQEAEAALTEFLGDNQIATLTNEIGAKEATLEDYYAAQRALDRLLADARTLREGLGEGVPSPTTGRNSLALLLLRARASTLSSGLPAELQVLLDQQIEIVEDPAQQLSELDTLIANLEIRQEQVQVLIDEGSLQQEILQLQEQLEQERATERELATARDLAWETYQVLLRKVSEVQVASQAEGTLVRFAVPAAEPESPIRPPKKLNTLLASVVGAMLAIGVSFFIEYLDDSLKTPEDVRRILGLPTLSSIAPLPAGAASGLITISQPGSPTSEGFRVLRTQLQMATDKPLKAVLVTSPNPLEGKSTIVANLGAVMAQAGRSTIIVDSDMRRPVLHEMFGLPNTQGLSNVLPEDGSDPGRFLQATDVENLRVLTSGPLPPNPSELLSLPQMEKLVQRLISEVDVLLFDSPAALAVTDAALLAKMVDGVLLVVESGGTRRGGSQQALDGLTGVGANLVGVVLNRFRPGAAAEYYYHEGEQGKRKANRGRQPFGRRLLESIVRRMRGR